MISDQISTWSIEVEGIMIVNLWNNDQGSLVLAFYLHLQNCNYINSIIFDLY